MNVVIIEDEMLAAEDLSQTLQRVAPEVSILAHLNSVKEAIDYFKEAQDVDLIFSDIQLGDGISFEVFDQVEVLVPIVFCTAYDDYLLDAFKTNGIDYILKPISDTAIRGTMNKYFSLQKVLVKEMGNQGGGISPVYQHLIDQVKPKPSSILVHQQDRIIPLNLDDIALCYIEHENVFIKTFKGKDFLVMKTLDELEKQLGADFYRANRQHLLSRHVLRHASYTLARKLALDLIVEHRERIYVSREKSSSFLRWLERGVGHD
ncbi:response regulator transcription factor [Sphingobacterium psychroaquaticum]|uniref:LytR/AlgR family response regulator transcription factor n=1 Tax=Sphingobacterium psychroaquaticum TaxID=561061 RepID=UPI00106AE1E8|nr:LytTR family DNA-binding domain-containing protein [Sphingobacterium psychroaquaticum]QBQ41024.1 response regulator transcription factor [Sphingobacterium psychroaquaticum]